MIEYVVLAVGVTVAVPDVAPPVLKPLPVHELAPLELQVMVTGCPAITVEGLALRLTVGGVWPQAREINKTPKKMAAPHTIGLASVHKLPIGFPMLRVTAHP